LAEAKESNTFVHSPQFIEIKAKTEDLISKRYREMLGTQLDKNSFTINAIVRFQSKITDENKKNTSNSKPTPTKVPNTSANINANADVVGPNGERIVNGIIQPEDITTGMITLTPLLMQYQLEIFKLQNELAQRSAGNLGFDSGGNFNDANFGMVQNSAQAPIRPDLQDSFEITQVEILLGIDAAYSKTYRQEIEEWLKKAVELDFAKKGSYKISTIRKIEKPEEKPKPLTPMEQLTNLQILIGLGLLALVALLGLLAQKAILSKDVREQTQTALRIQEMRAAQTSSERNANSARALTSTTNKPKKDLEKEKSENSEVSIRPDVLLQTLRELQQKIGALSLKMSRLNEQLFTIWFEQGFDGRLKVASFIDAILSRQSLTTGEMPENSTNTDIMLLIEKWRHDNDLQEAFRAFPEVNLADKNHFLEQVYWDMLSVNLLGSRNLDAPFEILQELPDEKLKKVFSLIDIRDRTLALMHLPGDRVRSYLKSIHESEKQAIIESSISLREVPVNELNSISENLKAKVRQTSGSSANIEMSEQIPNLLFSLSCKEEFTWLPNALKDLPDKGISIKRSYPSIAFLHEWPDDILKTFFEGLDTKLLVAYLRLMPSMAERIKGLVSQRLTIIINDELISKRTVNEKDLDKNLEQLKIILHQRVMAGSISLGQVFALNDTPNPNHDTGSVRRKAS
jgi:hypothetical protein